jgi:hypothetical protein
MGHLAERGTRPAWSVTIDALDSIRVNFDTAGVSVEDFVLEVRKHTQNE